MTELTELKDIDVGGVWFLKFKKPVFRYIYPTESLVTPFLRIPLMCKNGIHTAKYRLILDSCGSPIYKLDKRSIRFADGVNFVEN